MKTGIFIAPLVFALVYLTACAPEPNRNPRLEYTGLLHVIPPEGDIPGQTGRQLSIDLKFTGRVDPATVVVGKTLLLRFPNDRNAKATLTWTDDRSLRITTDDVVTKLAGDVSEFNFSLILIGNAMRPQGGAGPVVKSLSGRILDGDRNSQDGGNYVGKFRVVLSEAY
jgi:hypothetical protein